MKGAYLIFRCVPSKEDLYRVIEENHEGACGGHFSFKITLQKILQGKVMCGQAYKRMYIIGADLAKSAKHMGIVF